MNLYFYKKKLTCIIQCRRGQQNWQLSISIKPMKYWPATQVGFDWLIFAFSLIAWSELKNIINIATTHSNECLFSCYTTLLSFELVPKQFADCLAWLCLKIWNGRFLINWNIHFAYTFITWVFIRNVMEAKCTAHDFFPFWWQSRDSHAMSICKQHFLLGV